MWMVISLWELQSNQSLKDASSTEKITQSSVNYLHKRKSKYLCALLLSQMNENTFFDSFFFCLHLSVSMFFSSVCIFVFQAISK